MLEKLMRLGKIKIKNRSIDWFDLDCDWYWIWNATHLNLWSFKEVIKKLENRQVCSRIDVLLISAHVGLWISCTTTKNVQTCSFSIAWKGFTVISAGCCWEVDFAAAAHSERDVLVAPGLEYEMAVIDQYAGSVMIKVFDTLPYYSARFPPTVATVVSIQVDPPSRLVRLGWVDFHLWWSTILPTCSVSSA